MIYTTYFGNLKKMPQNIVPIAICGKSPNWYNGLEYKKLAPKYSFFSVWKQNHDNEYYIEHFQKEVLDLLNPQEIVRELSLMSEGNDVALVCYEKPGDFCHRHLVAKWLNDALNMNVVEL